MQRVTRSTAVAVLPAPPSGAGAPGYFSGGNSGTGTPATIPGYEWFNGVQEELMAVVLAAGLIPSAVDNTQLLQAIQSLVAIPTGAMLPFPGSAAPSGWAKLNGITVPRTGGWSNLWAYAQSSGNLVTDAVWLAGRPASFSSGDGATTFRIPDLRGLFVRGYHDGSGTYESATGTALGEYRDSRNKAHTHSGNVLPSSTNTSASSSGTAEEGASAPNYALQSIGSEGGADAYPRHVTALWCVKL